MNANQMLSRTIINPVKANVLIYSSPVILNPLGGTEHHKGHRMTFKKALENGFYGAPLRSE